MFAVIRHYHFDKKDSAEIDRLIEEQFVPIMRKAKGFDRYYWLDTGNGEGASFGVFKRQGRCGRIGGSRGRVRAHAYGATAETKARSHRRIDQGARLIDDSTAMSRAIRRTAERGVRQRTPASFVLHSFTANVFMNLNGR